MNLICTGTGRPVTILEGGWQAGAAAWGRIRTALSATTTTCAYDRAGYGASDPGPMPRTARSEAADLAAMLRAARLPGPYLIVAHSLGGLVAQAWAARADAKAAGMLLLDPSFPGQTRAMAAAAPDYGRGIMAWEAGMAPCAADPNACRRALTQTLASEIASMAEAPVRREYGAMPLVVMSSGRPLAPMLPPDQSAALMRVWQGGHAAIAARSRRGRHIVLEGSGHLIPKERPDAVIAAARDLIAAIRRPLAM